MQESDIKEIKKLSGQIASERFAPLASEIDRNHTFPWKNIRTLGEADLLGLVISGDEGGLGLGRAGFTAVVSEIAKACASTALIYISHSIVAKAIEFAGSLAVKNKWLPEMLKGQSIGAFAVHEPDSGSNSAFITTHARKEGDTYIVNGSKFFITSAGEANIYLVLVRTESGKGPQGMTTLLVEKNTPGLSFGRPEDKMGLKGTSSRELFFNNCQIPVVNIIGKEGEGIQIIGKTVMGWGLFGAAAISVGIAKAATELAIKHVKTRIIAGQPIAVHPAVQFHIADMIVKTEAAESFLKNCVNNADSDPGTAVINGFKTKLFTSETAVDVTNLAIQAMGGHGYCSDYIVERLFRDARGLTLHFKTSEWLRQDIAKIITEI